MLAYEQCSFLRMNEQFLSEFGLKHELARVNKFQVVDKMFKMLRMVATDINNLFYYWIRGVVLKMQLDITAI